MKVKHMGTDCRAHYSQLLPELIISNSDGEGYSLLFSNFHSPLWLCCHVPPNSSPIGGEKIEDSINFPLP